MARVEEDADGDRHLLLRDQGVEDDRDPEPALVADVGVSVLEDHDRGGRRAVVLGGDVDPILANRAREDLALPDGVRDLALGHALLALGFRRMLVRLRLGEHHQKCGGQGRHATSLSSGGACAKRCGAAPAAGWVPTDAGRGRRAAC